MATAGVPVISSDGDACGAFHNQDSRQRQHSEDDEACDDAADHDSHGVDDPASEGICPVAYPPATALVAGPVREGDGMAT